MAKKQEETASAPKKNAGAVRVRCLTGSTINGVVYQCGEVYEMSADDAKAVCGLRFELVKG
jgi:hypothetical protein